MKKKTYPIYLYPDHTNGSFVQMEEKQNPTFLVHSKIHKCITECEKEGLNISVVEAKKPIALPKKKGVFVSVDNVLRELALKKGHLVAPSLAIAREIALGRTWALVKFIIPSSRLSYLGSLQSYVAERRPNDQQFILGLLTLDDFNKALKYANKIEKFDFNLDSENLIALQIDNKETLAELHKKFKLLFSEGNRHFLALSATDSVDSIHIHGAHGHNFALYADYKHVQARQNFVEANITSIPESIREATVLGKIEWWKYLLKPSSATSFENRNGKYSGLTDLDSSGAIASRHILHPDNERTEDALFNDLAAMGYAPQKHSFQLNGNTYHNIVADLPGVGRWRLKARILQSLVRVFRKPSPDMSFIKKEIGNLDFEGSEQVINSLNNNLHQLLRPYRPWWRLVKICFGADILVVGCHLDSTASFSPGYNPATDSAPGRDDNASGIAAILEMANYFRHFRNCFTHTIRFCFFNAEEQGLVGSKAYAQFLKNNNAPVKAAICLDMVGYNSDSNHLFEIHAGYTDPVIRDRSVPFADEISLMSEPIFGAGKAQIYQGTDPGPGTDRLIYDGAINRSDHAAFHEQGYPAVVVSEDFFSNTGSEPGNDGNPNYHKQDDTVIDPAYGSKITCAIANAVREFVK